MSPRTQTILSEAYLAYDGEWVVMDLVNADCLDDWGQEGVVLFHSASREEAHSAAQTKAKYTRDDGSRREIWVFKGTKRLVPGEHLLRACESIGYRHHPPQAIELEPLPRRLRSSILKSYIS